MPGYSFLQDIFEFISELFASLSNGYLFFGSTADIIKYVVDILLVTFVFYSIIIFLRQTRAWQLIKGIAFILVFVFFCDLMGLNMVGYVFDKFLYVIAIMFIVIFQPELRRALETVGLNSLKSIRRSINNKGSADNEELISMVDEISEACINMAQSYTGALILIERSSRLDELLEQENAVKVDFGITKETIESIFYKGAPMHDGGVLIRDGRIIGARCHVPLSVNMHSMDRTGTRHRAAVGASELGDTVVVVVSEERGKASIAVNGKLYEMKDKEELKSNLSYLFGLETVGEQKKQKRFFPRKSSKELEKERKVYAVADAYVKSPMSDSNKEDKNSSNVRAGIGSRLVIILISFIASVFLWMYIQVTTNPVISETLSVPISYSEGVNLDGVSVAYPIANVEIEVVGRKDTISQLTADDVVVYLDYSQVNGAGVYELPLIVESADAGTYFRVQQMLPETISVTVYGSSEVSTES